MWLSFAVVAILLVGVRSQWAAIASSPAHTYDGDVCPLQTNKVMYVRNWNFIFDGFTGEWTSKQSSPNAGGYTTCASSAANNVYLFGGGPPPLATVFNYQSALDAWTSSSAIPEAGYQRSIATDGVVAFVCCGYDSTGPTTNQHTDNLWIYNMPADAWTTRNPSPKATRSQSADYADGDVIVVGGVFTTYTLHHYTIAQDVWKTGTQSPVNRGYQSWKQVAGVGGYYYIIGGDPAESKNTMSRYHVSTMVWTTISVLAPVDFGVSCGGVLQDGRILFTATPTQQYTFDTGIMEPAFALTLQGDPLLSSFNGDMYHFDLCAGVFNVFSSPSLSVNAMLVEHPTLPPGENLVAMALGIKTKVNTTNIQITCTPDNLRQGSCNGHVATAAQPEFELVAGGMVFHLREFSLEIIYHIVAVIEVSAAPVLQTAYAPSSYFDISIMWHPDSGTLPPISGLLGDLHSLSYEDVVDRLTIGDYIIASGQLFDSPTPAELIK